MPTFSTLLVFMAAVLALNLTPGPDMLFCLATGLGRGRAAGAVAALGVGAGCTVHTLAAAFGLAGLLAASPLAFDIVRLSGAAYLAWLAWKVLRSAPMLLPGPAAAGDAAGATAPVLWRIFASGALTNVLNPKVALFFLAFLPQFIDPAAGDPAGQAVVLGLVIGIQGTLVNVLVGISAGGLSGLFRRRPRLARIQQWLTGSIFAALAARLAWGIRP